MGRRPQKRREMLRGAVIKKKMTVSLPFLRNPPHPTTAGWVRAPGIDGEGLVRKTTRYTPSTTA